MTEINTSLGTVKELISPSMTDDEVFAIYKQKNDEDPANEYYARLVAAHTLRKTGNPYLILTPTGSVNEGFDSGPVEAAMSAIRDEMLSQNTADC